MVYKYVIHNNRSLNKRAKRFFNCCKNKQINFKNKQQYEILLIFLSTNMFLAKSYVFLLLFL